MEEGGGVRWRGGGGGLRGMLPKFSLANRRLFRLRQFLYCNGYGDRHVLLIAFGT